MAEPRFEEALNKLEAIVEDLENGDLNLDEAIKKYEEGMNLSKFCYKKLQEIQKKIEVLVKDSTGKLSAKDFGATDTEEPDKAKQKSPTKKKRPKGEELLF
jgi:exodeoxyribonuclease VII small subunit